MGQKYGDEDDHYAQKTQKIIWKKGDNILLLIGYSLAGLKYIEKTGII